MNRKQAAFLAIVAVSLVALASVAWVLTPGPELHPGQMEVVATFYPIYCFCSEVGGDRVHVDTLIPFNSEPHSWEPAPADILRVDSCRVFVYNGAGMEPWVGKFLGAAQHRDAIRVVDTSKGIDVKKGDTDSPGGLNPHFWVDPVLAKQQVENIRAGLAAADPAGASYYEQRADDLKARLDALDGEFRTGLENRTKNVIVTTHEGFDYMAERYNFTAYSVLGISPDQEPSAEKMGEIVRDVESYDLTVIYGEPVYSDRYMQAIASSVKEQTGRSIQVLVLDGIHGRSGTHAGLDYFQIQRENIKALQFGLGVPADVLG